MPYQSFPEKPGDSNSPAKLAALALPPLAGKRFLDVGCNEGYFCGYAFFDAAARILGMDRNQDFIEAARRRFPQCDFLLGDWNDLAVLLAGEKPFDVILCASALHYAANQQATVEAMMARLARGGVLVLEISMVERCEPGVCEEAGQGWFWVKRSIDRRLFPSWQGIDAMLAPYVYKHMGQSAGQIGDPLPRHVFHVRHRLPFAVLLMGAPASGKTTAARKLLGHLKCVKGDVLLAGLRAHCEGYPLLASLAEEKISWTRLDTLTRKIFDAGACHEYARLIADSAGGADFVFDGFIPGDSQDRFAAALQGLGYQILRLETPAGEYSPNELSRRGRLEARKYQLFLSSYATASQRLGKRRGQL